jgi:hypothetical protein
MPRGLDWEGLMYIRKFGWLTLGALLFAVTPAHAENWKKNYCGNQDYIPAGNKYPHLHCGTSFYTYSKLSSSHVNMVNGDQVLCAKVNSTIAEIQNLPDVIAGKQAMLTSVQSVKDTYCK